MIKSQTFNLYRTILAGSSMTSLKAAVAWMAQWKLITLTLHDMRIQKTCLTAGACASIWVLPKLKTNCSLSLKQHIRVGSGRKSSRPDTTANKIKSSNGTMTNPLTTLKHKQIARRLTSLNLESTDTRAQVNALHIHRVKFHSAYLKRLTITIRSISTRSDRASMTCCWLRVNDGRICSPCIPMCRHPVLPTVGTLCVSRSLYNVLVFKCYQQVKSEAGPNLFDLDIKRARAACWLKIHTITYQSLVMLFAGNSK